MPLYALEELKKRNILSSSKEEAFAALHNWDGQYGMARDEQVAPDGDWQTWLFLAGRGAGKTRSGAEWIRSRVKHGYRYIGFIAPTAADCRDVMVEGPSGVLNVGCDQDGVGRPVYEPSKRRVTWPNGASATMFSAEEPDRLRGPQHDTIWADELAAWYDAQHVWDMAMFGLRVGVHPQVMVSTTPRPIALIRDLIASPTTNVTRATTFANRANLAPSFFDSIIKKYNNTHLGRQELMGEVVDEMLGALWTRAIVDAARDGRRSELARTVVAVDPAVTANPTSNLTGIVVAAVGKDKRGYVIDDLSGRYSPDAWARKAVMAFDEHDADRIVAEGNQGGELVRMNLNTVRPNLPIRIVHASRSKQARAEPVAALYEQKKVTHVKPFPELEDQLCTWEPLSGDESPDRLDALVWAMTDLMLKHIQTPPMIAPVIVGTPRVWPGDNREW